MQIVTWPFKKFFGYVCGKLLAGYLESDLDFQKLGYRDGALSIRDIVLNPAKINESLKDIPYKVLSANIKNLKVTVPRHFLTESIKIVISDVDVLIMPIIEKDKKEAAKAEEAKSFIVPSQPKPSAPDADKKQEKPASPPNSPPEDPADTSAQIPQDEDALTKAINGVLANLECEIHNLSIRVLTSEFHPEEQGTDLPTFLLRFTHIEYKNQKLVSPEKIPESGKLRLSKTVLIGQFAVFLMNKPILSRDEYGKDPSLSSLVFPFTYPPICHPSTILVCETNTGMAAKINLKLDFEKKLHKVSASLNNLDVLLSPLQLYTLTRFVNYAEFLFSTYNSNSKCESPGVSNNIPVLAPKPTASPEKHRKAPSAETKLEVNVEVFRVTIRMLFDDSTGFKRYYHPYKSEELPVEGPIPLAQWKTPYNFIELLIVNTNVTSQVSSEMTECTGKVRYANLTTNILQNFALRRNGQVLDDSVATIYTSAHRAFSAVPEVPNFLVEDTAVNPNRFHFCVQRLIELKRPNSVHYGQTVVDEWESIIDNHLDPLKTTIDQSQDAMNFCLKVEKREGKITGDQRISIFGHDAKFNDSGSSISLISIEVNTSGIIFDLSPDAPIYFDHVLNPTGGMLLHQSVQYTHIFELYNTDALSLKLSGMEEVAEEVKEVIPLPERIPVSQSESKDWILQKLVIEIPYIRVKAWIMDIKKNQILDYYKDRNVDSCRHTLERIKNPNSSKSPLYLKENPLAILQVCRCMDLCRLADNLSGGYGKLSTSISPVQYLYYRDELVVLDVVKVSVNAKEIHESAMVTGRLMIQALLADFKIGGANLYANLNGKISWVAKAEFEQSPYSIRVMNRSRITHGNKMLADAEIVGDKVRLEYSPEEVKNTTSEKLMPKESEIGIIDTTQKKEVKVSFQPGSEGEKYNPFMWEASEFMDRETQMKQYARTYVAAKLKGISIVLNLESIPGLGNFAECCNDTIYKMLSILEDKANVMNEIEGYLKDSMKKRMKKSVSLPVVHKKLEVNVKDKEAEKSAIVELEADLQLLREESKLTMGVNSDSSDSSESGGTFLVQEQGKQNIDEEDKGDHLMKSERSEEPGMVALVFNLSVANISAYLCESKAHSEKVEARDPPGSILDEEFKYPFDTLGRRFKHPIFQSNPTLPLLVLKFDFFQSLIYKVSEWDTQIKLQVSNAILMDNTLDPPPLYSPNCRIEELKKAPSKYYVSDNLMNANEGCEYFLTNHTPSIVLYKEEVMKDTPVLTLSIKLMDKQMFGNIHASDMENECVIDIGVNGVIFRPEPHTEAFHKVIKTLVNSPSNPVSAPSSPRREEPEQQPVQNPFSTLPHQLVKVNLTVRNLTIDIWPVAHLSYLLEIDPPILPPNLNINSLQKCRSRQRILLLLDRLTFKYVSAPFVGQEKLSGHLEDTRLAAVNCEDSLQILLLDKEALLNSTLSLIHKLGFCDLATLEKLEVRYSSQEKDKKANKEALQRVEVYVTTLAATMCYDGLIAGIRSANCILSEIGELHFGQAPEPHVIPIESKEVKKTTEAVPHVSRTYEVKRQARREELKLSKELAKSDLNEIFEIVSQDYKKDDKTMRKTERIDSVGMKQAFALMDANPDYLSRVKVAVEHEGINEKIEGDVIMQKTEEGSATIMKAIEFHPDHIVQPKIITYQYETEYHSLPEDCDKPKFTFCASINKVALVLFEGSDMETTVKSTKKDSSKRKTDSFVEVSLQNIGAMFNQFPEKGKRVFRGTLSIEDLTCTESLSQTYPTSMLGMIHHENAEHFAKVCVEMLNTISEGESLPELVLKVKLEPLQVTLHQKVLEFLREYALKCHKELFEDHAPEEVEPFNDNAAAPEEKKVAPQPPPAAPQKDVFIQKANISQFYVKFNYRSYKLSMTKLYNKELFELLNIADIRDLVITFKKFEGRGFNNFEELTKNISGHYANDILDNQLLTCVTAVSPIRSITNVVGGFIDIFRLPVLSYRKRKRLWTGLTQGVSNFFSKVATETKLIGQTVLSFAGRKLHK